MVSKENNYAFIDAQNMHMQTRALGWSVDVFKLRVHLKETYGVTRAYWFVGLLPEMQEFYTLVQNAGFTIIFKEVSRGAGGVPKGNVDVDLTLHAVDLQHEYDGAVLVTSDGDFASLVRYLQNKDKLRAVISPHKAKTSKLLQKAVGPHSLQFLEYARHKIERKKSNQ